MAESCITNKNKMLGAEINLDILKNERKDAILFGESPSRIVVSVKKSNLAKLQNLAKKYKIPYRVLGKVTKDALKINCNKKTSIDISVSKLSKTWREAIPSRLS